MTEQATLNLPQGEAAKERGLDLVSSNNWEFIETMRDISFTVAYERGQVTIDDLRESALRLGIAPQSPNAWGAVLRGKTWKCVGYTQSRLPSNHARTIKIWALA